MTESGKKGRRKKGKPEEEDQNRKYAFVIHWFFFFMILLIILTGYLLYVRMRQSMALFAADQVSRQARTVADLISEQTVTEVENLHFFAKHFENNEDDLQKDMDSLQKTDPMVIYGVLGVDGSSVFGEALQQDETAAVMDALHGSDAISYVKGRGLIVACPVKRGEFVRYILYEIIPRANIAKRIYSTSDVALPKSMIRSRAGETVYIFDRVPEDGVSFLQSEEALSDLQEMFQVTEMEGSASRLFTTKSMGRVFLYEAEISDTDFLLTGYIEEDEAAGAIQRISVLVMWVFSLLTVLFVLGAIYIITNQTKITKVNELTLEKKRAEAESNSKSSFLASMSHEIRTPINAVLGINEMILREFDDPKLTGYATNIKDAGNTLLNIINDVLDYSKMESGKLSIVPVDYDLAEMINELVTMIRPRAVSKSLNLIVKVDETMPHMLHGDNVRIKQCVLNILTNAVKYTDHGQVVFNVTYEPGEPGRGKFTFSVQDTGIGIRPEDMEKLYKPFERLDEEKNHGIEGTGLGLSITNRLLAMMNSALKVDSVYGEGSTFSFTVEQFILAEEPMGDFRRAYQEKIENAPAYHQAFTAPEARILVVDDTDMNLFVVQGLLKETKIHVDTAESGESGLAKLRVDDYDLVLIDHKMPGMDGIEMLHRLRRESMNRNQHKPCIALTANAMSGAREYYLNEGFEDYLSKPIDSDALENMLMKYLPAEKISVEKEPEIGDPVLAAAVTLLRDRRNHYTAL